MPANTTETNVIIKWKEAQGNGASITQYNVYQRIVNDDSTPRKWNKIREIKDPSVRSVEVQLEKGKDYEFVVTATNKFGEGYKEDDKIKKISVLGGRYILDIAQTITATQTQYD